MLISISQSTSVCTHFYSYVCGQSDLFYWLGSHQALMPLGSLTTRLAH